jgi:hypothetical protein
MSAIPEEPNNRVFTAPWRQVVRIKKGAGPVVQSPEVSPLQSGEPRPEQMAEKPEMDKKVDALVQLSWLSLGLTLLGIVVRIFSAGNCANSGRHQLF